MTTASAAENRALPLVRRALRLATPVERRRVAAAAALGTLAGASGTALLALSGYLIARAAEQPPVLSLTVAIVCVRALGLVRAVARYGERLVGHDAVLGILARIRASAFAGLAAGPPSDAASTDLLDRAVADVDRVQDAFLRSLAPLAAAAAVGVAAVAAAALLLPKAALALAATVLVIGVVLPVVAQAVGRGAARARGTRRSELIGDLAATLDGAEELVMAGAGAAQRGRVRERGRSLARVEDREAALDAVVAAGASAAAGLGTVAVLAVALAAVADGVLAATAASLLALLALGVGEVLGGAPAAARELHRTAGAVRRVEQLLAAPTAGGRLAPADATVRMRGVCIVRGGRTVVDGLDLDLAAGERLALLGPSGAGKSTVGELLVGGLPVEAVAAGRVEVGGVALADLDPRALRRRVLHVPQDPYLFDASLRANLALARPDADDATLTAALEAVGAGPWLAGLEQGLDALLGERGARCSGGERQRIGLARALLARGHSLVVLDEPASHLPEDEAVAILRTVLAAVPGRAALLIAHRPGEARLAERTLRLTGV
ncbi:thiol reductant ABC exporter subunit CydC [Patulibacter defluvii]|uniref:thiol reductant ABC exporter subunit CydC n=1 Tax=Patulibacter defluvii TaxID=3095358 RepID=UPI002A763D28|nr:thiol reductant ABC exporter subunit CydC [Patulibacter sp. DM4]